MRYNVCPIHNPTTSLCPYCTDKGEFTKATGRCRDAAEQRAYDAERAGKRLRDSEPFATHVDEPIVVDKPEAG